MVVVGKVFIILVAIMAIDYITGIISAIVNHNLNSRRGAKGIWKKIAYILGILLAFAVDYLISTVTSYNTRFACSFLIMAWYGVNEVLSILENLTEIGVPFPEFLTARLEQFRNKIDKGEIDNDIITGVANDTKSAQIQSADSIRQHYTK